MVFTTAALLAFAAFFAGAQAGGVRAGVVQTLAVLIATAAFGRAAYTDRLPRPFNASLGLILMALFAGVSALSVGWSLVPNASLLDAVRMIAYTCVLALAALAAQLHQKRAREILLGAGLAAMLIVIYALLSRAIPGLYPETDNFARIRLPFGYWNAVGCVGAMGLLIALWAGTRRYEPRWLEVLSYPAGGLCVAVVMLTQSRGALLAFAVVFALWLLLVPQRLRSVGWLAIVGVVAMLLVAWAYNKTAFSTDGVGFDDRKSQGLQLLVGLFVMSGLLAGIGALVFKLRHERPLAATQRYSIGKVLLILLAISPVFIVVGVGVGTDKGLTTFSDGVSEVFSLNTAPPTNSPERFTQTSSLRGRYWDESKKIFDAHTKHGTGADTFIVARLPYRLDQVTAGHAHGMVPQVAADLGVLGLLVLFALMAVWLLAALKLAGVSKRGPWKWLEDADEVRLASVALMMMALVFGVHSAIDWVWFIPAVAYFGLLAGGWVLGSPAAHSPLPADDHVPDRGGKLPIIRAVAVALVGIAIAAAVYQPVRAQRKVQAGTKIASSNPAKALKLGNSALKLDPTSASAFILVSLAESNGGRQQAAETTLAELTSQQPGNPTAWLRLAQFRLLQLNDPDGAIEALRPVLYQSPNNWEAAILLDQARKAKAEAILEKLAEKKRKALEKSLEQLEKLQKQAAAGVTAPAPTT